MRHPSMLVSAGIWIALLGCSVPAGAVVLIDTDVEDDGDWSTLSELVFTSNATYLDPAFVEGTEAADMNHSPSGDSIIRTFTGTSLQPMRTATRGARM